MKRYIVFSLLTILCAVGVSAQPITKSSYETMLEVAQEQLALGDLYNALVWYEKAFEEKEEEALIPIMAELNYQLRDFPKAERNYARLLRRDKADQYMEKRFVYGRILKMNSKYEEAIEQLQQFIAWTENDTLKELAQNEITGAEMAIAFGESTKGVTVENLGKDINTPFSEYSAVLNRDGSELYYAAFDAKDVIVVDESNTDYHAKIYKSAKADDGWSKPAALDTKINRPGVHTTNVTLAPDGRRMFFTRAILKGNELAEGKIYYSVGGDGEWGAAQEVVGVNGDWIAKQPAVGELFGKEVLFFVSDMEGGSGGFDLYYATLKGEGVYGDPVNLGPKINTPGDEETPYYRDGTLYFSSTGHPGMGGFDIFYSVWDGTRWSEPKNMGNGFNSSLDDHYFTLDAEGYNGFLLSNRPGGRSAHGRTCCDDIYSFSIPKKFVDLVVGVFDDKKQVLKGVMVQLIEMQRNVPGKTNSRTNEQGNRFDFPLVFDMPYRISVSKEGYYPDSLEFNTVGLTESKTFEHRFYLKAKPVPPPEPEFDTISIEEAIVLENILYDFDSDRIKTEAETDLQLVLGLMNDYPDMRIELRSHTDARGNDAYNEDLSQRRAESARRWLIRNGIPRERMDATGYGEKVPQTVSTKVAAQHDFLKEGDVLTEEFINKLATEEQKEIAHAINRRTEFKIVAGPTSIIIKRTLLRKKTDEKTPPNRQSLPATDTVKISELSSLHGKADLTGVPVMQFKQRIVDFGKVKKGEKRYHTYEFVNRGDTDLVIAFISACECTKVDYSTDPVKPGQKGKIDVTFDSTEKDYPETIDIDIILDNLEPDTGDPIMEKIQYKFAIVK